MAFHLTASAVSSTALRISALVALRYAHFHLITVALFVVFVSSFFNGFTSQPLLEVVSDEVDVLVEETPIESDAATGEPDVVAQEVVLREQVVVEEKYPSPRDVLLYGMPSRAFPKLSALTFLLNLLLVGFTVDALYGATYFYPVDDLSFVRLGYVSHSQANFLIREPDQTKMPITMEIHIKETLAAVDNPSWQRVGSLALTSNDTDFTSTLTVPLTHPGQRLYEWRTSNNHTGQFMTPPKPGNMPNLNDGKFTFLSTSCILPHFPYNPMDHHLSIPGMRHLAEKLPELGAQFMLFLGDFIYVDVPRRFGKSTDEYRKQYRQVYASPDWAPVAQNLSWIHVLDDHEISNDWSSNTTGVYNAAINPWNIYHASVNPPPAAAASSLSGRPRAPTWFEFVQGPASFFMMDTRSYRSHNSLPFDSEEKTMLGEHQLADLLAWLARPEPKGVKWKIIASSVPLTKNWPVNVQDTWGGFLSERQKILEAMWNTGSKGYGVVTLSGDRHEFAATKFPPPPESQWSETAAAYEFSTSPLNQFASPIPTYRQTDDQDVMLKYISSGRSKFAAITIEDIAGESTLQFRLYINGEEAWSTVIVAPHFPKSDSSFGSIWDKLKFT
ncbi:PhoD-like phosphatase-domain-containing protein [Stachybotrys elegans]|uniref:PhoD-like phosphatase-domain-containing protein n=1 Tax=Stachybotrys elegans TaxID=80388 RepID=A0A8K0SRB5_9HYPO|nr:PhoD-like phosphatase-domain-containing protein [Stachybotrys elegans]